MISYRDPGIEGVADGAEHIHHGGEPPIDAAGNGADWLDLSTGIAPIAYPFDPPSPDSWRQLPRRLAEQKTLEAAAGYFGMATADMGGGICFGPGSQALLQLLPDLLPAGVVAVLGPTYCEHAYRWARAGHELHEISGLADLADLPAQCRYVVVVNPNSPTGAVHGAADLLSLAAQLAARDGFLIVDEAFCDVLPDCSLAGEAGRPGLLILRSFGKFFGLAGLRLGFLMGPADIIDAARTQIGPWPVNGPALAIAAQAYGDAPWIAGHRQMLAEQASKLQRLLAGHGEFVGGTDLFILLQTDRAADLSANLAQARIHVRRFPDHENWLRFGLPGDGAAWQRLTAALG
ncbi:MAG: threonine-phosphate decarboxylase [Rhodospirillales bacterium]|nr:threonine-phosphate decarboxylase [Rhodospirillales bacterium]